MEEPSSVVVAHHGNRTRRAGQRFQVIGHPTQAFPASRAGGLQHGVEEQHVERIHVVICRLLEVGTIRPHLELNFLRENPRTHLLPSPRPGKRREQGAQGVQGYGFAQQVGIAREID